MQKIETIAVAPLQSHVQAPGTQLLASLYPWGNGADCDLETVSHIVKPEIAAMFLDIMEQVGKFWPKVDFVEMPFSGMARSC
jgi:hypothetical protein